MRLLREPRSTRRTCEGEEGIPAFMSPSSFFSENGRRKESLPLSFKKNTETHCAQGQQWKQQMTWIWYWQQHILSMLP